MKKNQLIETLSKKVEKLIEENEALTKQVILKFFNIIYRITKGGRHYATYNKRTNNWFCLYKINPKTTSPLPQYSNFLK